MNESPSRRARRRVYPRIDAELGARLAAYCARTAVTPFAGEPPGREE